jgi:hypothetical protein
VGKHMGDSVGIPVASARGGCQNARSLQSSLEKLAAALQRSAADALNLLRFLMAGMSVSFLALCLVAWLRLRSASRWLRAAQAASAP